MRAQSSVVLSAGDSQRIVAESLPQAEGPAVLLWKAGRSSSSRASLVWRRARDLNKFSVADRTKAVQNAVVYG
jgi:hypothetical protein